MTISFTAVDLSRLPAPTLIETISYEAVLAELVADLQARDPAYETLVETDPAMVILQVVAYRIVIERQRVNEAAKAVMIAYAAGADLDNLAAVFGVTRLTDETDVALRQRVVLAPESYSVAGPEAAYIFHARSADASILDASATSPAPGEVVVTLLSRTGDGTATSEQIALVEDVVNSHEIRPLTDNVTVQSATIIPFDIEATLTLFSGPDETVILSRAQQGLAAYVEQSKALGRDVTLSALYAALHVEGVQRVNIISPVADIDVDRTEAAHCTGQLVTLAGYGE